MNKQKILYILLAVSLIGASIFVTACSKDDDDSSVDIGDYGITMVMNLASDSENGETWEFEQDDNLFSYEEFLSEEEGDEKEDGKETQTFTIHPIKSGSTTIRFINRKSETTYSYDCTIDEGLDNVSVENEKGESAGKEAEAPKLMLERD